MDFANRREHLQLLGDGFGLEIAGQRERFPFGGVAVEDRTCGFIERFARHEERGSLPGRKVRGITEKTDKWCQRSLRIIQWHISVSRRTHMDRRGFPAAVVIGATLAAACSPSPTAPSAGPVNSRTLGAPGQATRLVS